ncbi:MULTISPECIES: hypothetical protein [unclassified Roseateles]|nr:MULTISPECIES: hypothetical protein [unclassified Roseateles]MCZ7881392.1 hypothetical protein [Paucibacter sp. M5-1]MDC6167414.1 hypothetical protein [Paucibacter sp. XJ19-41]
MNKQPLSTARAQNIVTALKALLLVAAVWGLLYPALLWSLERLLQHQG